MDFNSLTNGNPFYVLRKSEKPTLLVGVVKSKSQPRPQYQSNVPNVFAGSNVPQVVTIVATIDGREETFTDIPLNVEIAQRACMVLSQKNTGYTFTNFQEHLSVMFIAEATSAEQMYDTIQHETKHATEHISEYYNVDPSSEESAYLQGEIARNMFIATSVLFCPHCKKLSKIL